MQSESTRVGMANRSASCSELDTQTASLRGVGGIGVRGMILFFCELAQNRCRKLQFAWPGLAGYEVTTRSLGQCMISDLISNLWVGLEERDGVIVSRKDEVSVLLSACVALSSFLPL
jgi:hypothetical protein